MTGEISTTSFAGVITTTAGNGLWGYSDVMVPAVSAALKGPSGVAVDPSGNIYFTDSGNHAIRKVSTSGIISTVAGTGFKGISKDGESASTAELNGPFGIALGPSHEIYFSEQGNDAVRKIAADGTIHTVAGNGNKGYAGDGGPATLAELDLPSGIALDPAGNLYIADANNNVIRRVDPGGTITTVAGQWHGTGIANGGFAGDGGQALFARFAWPVAVALDGQGGLYIADTGNDCVRKLYPRGFIRTVAGVGTAGFSGDGGSALRANLAWPKGIVLDASGCLYIADTGNDRVRKVDGFGVITTVAGHGSMGGHSFGNYSGDGGQATAASLNWPTGVALDPMNNICIADTDNLRVRKVYC